MFVPLGSHDTERVLTVMGGNQAKAHLAIQLQFSLPGSPSIYYGDEIGLEGAKDPACRRTFPWDEKKWKPGLREFVQHLVTLRRRFAALRRGNLVQVLADDERHCLAFGRVLGQEKILVVVNASETRRSLRIPVSALGLADGHILHNLTGPGEYIVASEQINVSIPAWSCSWLI